MSIWTKMGRSPITCHRWLYNLLLCILVSSLVHCQFIHIFEVQDENRAPKSDLFDPAQYKYVSPAQLQKQQEQNKLLQAPTPSVKPPTPNGSRYQTQLVPETRGPVNTSMSPVSLAHDVRLNEIASHVTSSPSRRSHNAYSMVPSGPTEAPTTSTPATTHSITYMQPISRILANISTNEIPEQFEMELRKQIRMQQSENRYSRTTPLRVSAQNQRQYVVRVPPPFQENHNFSLPQQQLPPNLRQFQSGQYQPVNQQPQSPVQTGRLSTLNSALSSSRSNADFGVPSDLLNSFLQRTQQTPTPLQSAVSLARPGHQHSHRHSNLTNPNIYQMQPPYAANIGNSFMTTSQPKPSVALSHQTQANSAAMPVISSSAPTGRSINGVTNNAISLLQPPVSNKESLTDEDIRLIEEHNRKVRLFLQQRQAELNSQQERQNAEAAQQAAARAAAEQERLQRQKAEQEAAARAAAEQERVRRIKAEQEAAARAAQEQERIRRLQAEQERVQRQKAEQEAAARHAAERERIRRLQAEQEAEARAAAEQERIRRLQAEQERIRRIQAEQEAAARAAAEQERIRRIKAEQESAARAAAEHERIQRLKAEQEAAARAAAEHERIQRMKAEQEAAARAAAEHERIRKLRDQQELAARAAAEHERIHKLREQQELSARVAANQERIQQLHKLKSDQDAAAHVAAEQERLRQLRAQQEAAIMFAEAERDRIQRIRAEQELASYQSRNPTMSTSNTSTSNLAYQPEPNLALDDLLISNRQHGSGQHHNSRQSETTGLVDAARLRAEKEALAEQERLLRFQASQQALAQQQAAEQARLRRLREEELLKAEEERAAREEQERRILHARNEQSRLIHAARNAATRTNLTSGYTPYTEEINRYPSNYTDNVPEFRSLNNVRTPERRSYDSTLRSTDLPPSQSNIRAISSDYLRTSDPINQYGNQSSPHLLNTNRAVAASVVDNSVDDSNKATHYKAAKISLQELPPDLDSDGIPGVAGRDYPTLTQIPKTSFSCARQPLNGYYADTETACQVVHMCQMGGVQDSFLCPNGTIWNQEKFACQWWYEVSCATAPSFYALNNKLYKDKDGNPVDVAPSPTPSIQA